MVSLDSAERNAAFAKSVDARQVLLSDPDGSVATAFGVGGLGTHAKRWTFYVDQDGVVRAIDKEVATDTAGAEALASSASWGFRSAEQTRRPDVCGLQSSRVADPRAASSAFQGDHHRAPPHRFPPVPRADVDAIPDLVASLRARFDTGVHAPARVAPRTAEAARGDAPRRPTRRSAPRCTADLRKPELEGFLTDIVAVATEIAAMRKKPEVAG